MRRTQLSGGFTLIEVLIAFAIASLALGVLVNVAAAALKASNTAARYQEATVRAQSHLAEAVHGGALLPGEWDGDDAGGYHWRIRVMPSPAEISSHPAGHTSRPLTLYAVSVWINWHDGPKTREIRLDTEQIGKVIQPP